LAAGAVIFMVPTCLITIYLNKKGHYNQAGMLISCLLLFAIVFDIYDAAGDKTLVELASLLLNLTQKEGICCRYRGEEILILVPDMQLFAI
jgi:hypothetical protein